jgi:hypothetical protein
MTVWGESGNKVICVWFDKDQNVKTYEFSSSTLTAAHQVAAPKSVSSKKGKGK